MSFLSGIGAWFSKIWKSLKETGAHTAVTITEEIQAALKSGVAGFIAQAIESVFPKTGKFPEQLLADINKVIPEVLAAELAVVGLPTNPSADDILKFEQSVLAAFNVNDKNSKLYTTLAAQIYGIIKAHASGEPYTFAELVQDVEAAFEDYKNDLAAVNN